MPKNPFDPETLKIPAYLRNKTIITQDKQKKILEKLDKKQGISSVGGPIIAKAKAINKVVQKNSTLSETLAKIREEKKAKVRIQRQENAIHPTKHYELERKGKRRDIAIALPETIQLVGYVTDYWEKINVAAIKLTASVNKNTILLIEFENGLFKQPAIEMQIDRQPVLSAPADSHIGLKISKVPLKGGKVYKLC